MWDVYAALESDEKHELLGMHPNPSPSVRWGPDSLGAPGPYDEILHCHAEKDAEITLQDLLEPLE